MAKIVGQQQQVKTQLVPSTLNNSEGLVSTSTFTGKTHSQHANEPARLTR